MFFYEKRVLCLVVIKKALYLHPKTNTINDSNTIKMKKILLFLACIVCIVSCSSEYEEREGEQTSVGMENFKITPNEAIQAANSLLDDLDGKTTRGEYRERSVKTFEIISSAEHIRNTRGDANVVDTLLYLINFKDNEGFALMGADKRIKPVYAISSQGNLDVNDTVFNKGLSIALDVINCSASKSLSEYINEGKPICVWPYNENMYDTKLVLKNYVSPLLHSSVQLWSQGSPFNLYCKTKDGKNAAVGCSALSAAQMMSYYEWPKTLNDGTSVDWKSIKDGKDNITLAKFLKRLGDSDLLNVNYGASASSALSSNMTRTLVGMGYNKLYYVGMDASYMKLWLSSKVRSWDSSYGGPLLAVGERSSKEGHSWVIDGLIEANIYYAEKGANTGWRTYGEDNPLFHCVWGWGGSSNGYFAFDSVDGFYGSPIVVEPNETGDPIGKYSKKLQMITDFVPQK